MESRDENGEAERSVSRMQHIGRALMHGLQETSQQISTMDLNIHEGRLRASVAPVEYLPKVPDYPPSE
jgi:hypothetical protein